MSHSKPPLPLPEAIKKIFLFTLFPTGWTGRAVYLLFVVNATYYAYVGNDLMGWSFVMLIFGVIAGRMSAISDHTETNDA